MVESTDTERDPFNVPRAEWDTGIQPLPMDIVKQKIPWRTVIISLLMTLVGLTFIVLGIVQFYVNEFQHMGEEMLIGSILFVPGFYHTVLAIQAFRGRGSFEDLTAFESENLF